MSGTGTTANPRPATAARGADVSDIAVGIDVGGTNTDAVALAAGGAVLARTKAVTTPDVIGGIRAALSRVLADLGRDRSAVSRVMLGTTHATNAIARRRDLGRVAVIRLGAPAATAFPPLLGWPADLRETILAGVLLAGGGHLVDGHPIAPLDRDAVRRFLDALHRAGDKTGARGGNAAGGNGSAGDGSGAGGVRSGADAVAVSGIFSPSFPDQEFEVEALVREHLGDLPVSLSHQIGTIGLLDRENATVLNAALHGVARDVTSALATVIAEAGIGATAYFAQNDGTLMAVEQAARFPVLTIGSGPANSIRGAAHLSGAEHAVVVDVGGTTSDFGALAGGGPRESTMPREVGGVGTNFRMPDVLSLGLGGGTVVDPGTGLLTGDSVGYRIAERALLFGGGTPTLTDAAAARGAAIAGRRLPDLDPPLREGLSRALAVAYDRIESAVERMSLGRTGLPLVVVGGAGFLVPDRVSGASEVIRPGHGDVANAVGAAIALAGGRADEICLFTERTAGVERASRTAIEKAIQAGADPARVEVVDVSEIPISYSVHATVRISVKAAGPLAP
ncbi:hydantoinase/oxoprolinase family protein [Actinoplanes sp. NPDC051851]|uniref:hydantoinase/oxoprolinase family protein n=1 Tax=Actinoplanes sp. NPDC051851 TaxID=3154753 RepID=UPI0034399666